MSETNVSTQDQQYPPYLKLDKMGKKGTLTTVDRVQWWKWLIICCLVLIVVSVAGFLVMHRQKHEAGNSTSSGEAGGGEPGIPSPPVELHQEAQNVTMSNGIVSITLTVPGGAITHITYKGSDNLLDMEDKDGTSGRWNIVWNTEKSDDVLDKLEATNYTVIMQNENQTEISFTRTWNVSSTLTPLNVNKRFVMLRDSPGFYMYLVIERLQGWPAYEISEGRIVFQLNQHKFHYMAMSDERQRFMPTPEDRLNGQVLEYKEAVLLTNPSNPEFKGEVDDKYFYSCNDEDNKVHGWVSNDDPGVGFWLITPSDEFRAGGPLRQDLTSHVGPATLAKFTSKHYAGEDLSIKFQTDEYWKKVVGPFYIHLNSHASAKDNPSVLWDNAKQRMEEEVNDWPYSFPVSEDYVKSNQRGAVRGQLLVHDWFTTEEAVPGASAYVGLAPPGSAGSWQVENKGYQFWTHTDDNGNFMINNVLPGNYSLFAWVPGVLADFKHDHDITIASGSNVTIENVIFKAPRKGPTLWEIGIPDRMAAEFFIPDPDPQFKIHDYKIPIEKFRQYGLWSRYTDLYPNKDLVFTIGTSDYKKDWFFAHVTRNVGKKQYIATTWQILFNLKNVSKGANYTLQIALASAQGAELQVRFNDPIISPPHFTTGMVGRDNAVARHGIHGLYHFYSIGVEGSRLVVGKNTIYLKQANEGGPFKEVMYDYIRLEGPA